MRAAFLLPLLAILISSSSTAHESFLTPHIHTHHEHAHGDVEEAHSQAKETKLALEHSHADEYRLHVTTGARCTRFDLPDQEAHLFETGLGIAYDLTHWLQVAVEGRYGWFDSESVRADGWLPPQVGLEYHIPLAAHWEIGVGFKTQLPGVEPLAVEEWELAPEIEVRYDRGKWYAGVIGEFGWVLNGDSHAEHAEPHAEDQHEAVDDSHDEHEGEIEGDDALHEDAHREAHSDIHHIIDPHADVEFGWQTALGLRVLDQRLTLEARVAGQHVIQGQSDGRHFIRAGGRVIYSLSERVSILVNGSVPVGSPQRNEWQTDMAVRVSF